MSTLSFSVVVVVVVVLPLLSSSWRCCCCCCCCCRCLRWPPRILSHRLMHVLLALAVFALCWKTAQRIAQLHGELLMDRWCTLWDEQAHDEPEWSLEFVPHNEMLQSRKEFRQIQLNSASCNFELPRARNQPGMSTPQVKHRFWHISENPKITTGYQSITIGCEPEWNVELGIKRMQFFWQMSSACSDFTSNKGTQAFSCKTCCANTIWLAFPCTNTTICSFWTQACCDLQCCWHGFCIHFCSWPHKFSCWLAHFPIFVGLHGARGFLSLPAQPPPLRYVACWARSDKPITVQYSFREIKGFCRQHRMEQEN